MGIAYLPFAADQAPSAVDQAMAQEDGDRKKAQAYYAKTHTWSQRIQTVLTCLQDQFWQT
jgi:hypothetical protein